jgi:hypothetical protein
MHSSQAVHSKPSVVGTETGLFNYERQLHVWLGQSAVTLHCQMARASYCNVSGRGELEREEYARIEEQGASW